MMKKILFALILLLLIGCNKETQDSIIGTWALVDFTAINARTGGKMSATTDVETWSFNDAGSAYVNGSTPLKYYINGKYLSVTYVASGKETIYEIEELSNSTLKVYWYVTPGVGQDGLDCWYTFTKMK